MPTINLTYAKSTTEGPALTGREMLTAVLHATLGGTAATAAILLAVFLVRGVPSVAEGTEATIGAAQRYQAPQIEAKDVVVGDTSAQAVMQTETWDRIVKDETLRTLLQNQAFLKALRNDDFRAQLADPRLAGALAGAAFQNALRDRGFVAAIGHERFGAALARGAGCDEWGCGANSPVVDGARID